MKYLLKHGHLIVDGNKEYLDGAILIDGERIEDVYPQSNKIQDINEDYKIIDLQGKIVMPGFFDTHTHGINMISFDKCNQEDLNKASLYMAKNGTTSFFTSIAYDLSKQEIIDQLKAYDQSDCEYARHLGVHMEGPFLSKKHCGMGDGTCFYEPDLYFLKQILSTSKKLKQMTIAIEEKGAKECCELLKDNGVKVMVGHSDAIQADLNETVDGFTHLFNAMRSLHHRDLSLINAAFTNKYYCELICDGNHVDPSLLKIVSKNVDRNKIIIISDSSTALGLPDGEYEFLSKKCIKQGTKFKTVETGSYAGSVVCINDEIKVLRKLGVDYTDLLLYSSLNAYRLYGLDAQYGSLIKGKYSDIVIMDEELNVVDTMVRGKFINE